MLTEKSSKIDPMEALNRATLSESTANYTTILDGFKRLGIPESEIRPRETVLTYGAWIALKRRPKKGARGVEIVTRIPVQVLGAKRNDGQVEIRTVLDPRPARVYHISETEPVTTERRAS